MRRKTVRRRIAVFRIAMILCIAFLIGGIVQFRRVFMEYAVNLAEDSAQQEINSILRRQLDTDPEKYGNLIQLEYDKENHVTALRTDIVMIDRLKADVVTLLFDELSDLEQTTVEVPLGTVFAPWIFSGRGPSVDIGMVGMGQMSAECISAFTSAGINQTRHNILLEIHAGIRILTPFGGENREIVSRFPLTDTVLVGNVPEQYLSIGEPMDGLLGKIEATPNNGQKN